MESRIKELDYLKAVFIVLMVMFHLVHFSQMYPYLKNVVYTFHMPAFLIISGYLTNVCKAPGQFLRTQMWIFIPYAFMELWYVVMSSVLPVREAVDSVTPGLLLYKIFVDPLGPYWYLHTIVVCSMTYFLVYRYVRLSGISRFIVMFCVLFVLSKYAGLMDFSSAMYFAIGVAVSQSKLSFTQVFRPCFWALIPLVAMCAVEGNLNRFSMQGMAITYLAISFSLFVFEYAGERMGRVLSFVGRNTLVILLFSPIFTMLAKLLVPVFAFDPLGVLFMVVAVGIAVPGCFAIGWGFDRLNLSRFCFGKSRVLSEF